ncbi:hypothetical protein M501DRAFT_1032988 [Patellaria atrata CBS 101060]|uniref:Uncharacterized protein n=1 Tax=Patellaria atrata CBS 101060 TaxID=1346257 RepID=A0A9P4S7A8_9PEZI|nr:hypothetical protein M501DRAFT_1032988 [Patellaria atrata CBS 101060]
MQSPTAAFYQDGHRFLTLGYIPSVIEDGSESSTTEALPFRFFSLPSEPRFKVLKHPLPHETPTDVGSDHICTPGALWASPSSYLVSCFLSNWDPKAFRALICTDPALRADAEAVLFGSNTFRFHMINLRPGAGDGELNSLNFIPAHLGKKLKKVDIFIGEKVSVRDLNGDFTSITNSNRIRRICKWAIRLASVFGDGSLNRLKLVVQQSLFQIDRY